MIGRLIKYYDDRGFGFLRVAGRDTDVFVHIRDAQASGLPALNIGDCYEFEESLDPRKGKMRAVNLSPVT